MNNWSQSPLFVCYAIACVVLCCNLLGLWVYSGAVRSRVKSTPNAEDAALFGSSLSEQEPPDIARVLRAHANAQASIYPFIVMGMLYVLAPGPLTPAVGYFTLFCVARIVHSFAYVTGRQPWRTIAFLSGGLVTLVLTAHVVWLVGIAR